MAKYITQETKILGCSIVLGEEKHIFADEPDFYNHDRGQLARLQKMIGFDQRYTAKASTTTNDLCRQASRTLLSALQIEPSEIGAIVSVTQTPDYRIPGNAFVLHKELGLLKTALALDVTLGCSGFVYGLWLASLILNENVGKVLLVAGDTLSKITNKKDRATYPLFGDAGSAMILHFSPAAADAHFILQADGNGLDKLMVPAGGYRLPSNCETALEVRLADGGFRSQDDFYMDGFGVFEFTMTEQPPLLTEIIEFSGKAMKEIDYFLFHQANRYIVQTLARSLKLPQEKVPQDIFSRFGNQNSASIPGILCGALADKTKGKKLDVIMQGFGVGLSWGACHIQLDDVLCLKPQIYSEE